MGIHWLVDDQGSHYSSFYSSFQPEGRNHCPWSSECAAPDPRIGDRCAGTSIGRHCAIVVAPHSFVDNRG
jgi:hypothetical protein